MNRIWAVTAAILAVTIAFEIAFRGSAHHDFFWQAIPGFDFAYGFVSCWLIVIVSKWLGKTFIQRDEDYYGDEES